MEKPSRYGTFIGSGTEPEQEFNKHLAVPLLKRLDQRLKESRPGSDESDNLVFIKNAVKGICISATVKDEGNADFRLSHQELDWMLRHPEDKWVDYLSYRYRFKVYPQLRKLTEFPLHLLIEPASICNLRCIMCYQTDEKFTRNKKHMGLMPWELFTRIVDEACENQCQAITLASRGEPTLHKEFGKMLRYLSDARIMDVKINTNATRLNEKLIHDILSSEVSELVFSIDASTKNTYESIRIHGNFDKVVANIEKYNDIRYKHYPKSPTVTRITGVKVNNDQDLEHMSYFWKQRVDHVVIKNAMPRWDTYENAEMNIDTPCTALWERVYVWFDGTINPCDVDYRSFLALGNIREISVREIWKSPAYNELRNKHEEKRRSEKD